MSNHTKGPWAWVDPSVGDARSEECMILRGADQVVVCHFGDSTTYYPSCGLEPEASDMALIAAAPDLLAALEEFMAHGEQAFGHDFGVMVKARAAIAKARGELPA